MVRASFFHGISFSYRFFILLFFFGGIHGFTISRQPNRTTIAFAGSNVTLSWNLILTPKEKTELLEVWFGTWNDNFKMIVTFLMKLSTRNGSIVDATENSQKARRWHWNGDISRNYTIAYQLTNAQHNDAGDYGIRVRTDTWPPWMESKGPFSLAIREPPVKPTVVTEPHTEKSTEPTSMPISTAQPVMEAFETEKDDNNSHDVVLYASISGAVVLVVFCAMLVCMIYRRRSKTRNDNSHYGQNTLRINDLVVINPTFSGDQEWEIPRGNLNIEKVIGRGAFGVVSRGLAWDIPGRPGWTVVAVKSIQEDASEREKRDLLSEFALLKNLDPHPHVIQLFGCVSTETRPLVVVEYAQYGDLLGYLRKSRGLHDNYYSDPSVKPRSTLISKQLLKFAWEISDGMEYLSMKKIIHRDLAARNVLVGEDEVCKITDFGMARDVQEEDIYIRTHEGRLPIKWTAPEAFFGGGAYTTASDVWSFGVVLYEIFTVGGDPFPGVYMRDIPALLENGYRMSRPKYVNSKLYKIMTGCWENEASQRPNFTFLRTTFHNLMEEENQEYVNLEGLLYENVLPSNCKKVNSEHGNENDSKVKTLHIEHDETLVTKS